MQRAAQKIVVILGPTGVGKSQLSMSVARELNGAIVYADSVAVYRGMDIGSAKPSRADRTAVSHFCIDIAEPDEPFEAARYAREARLAIDSIVAAGRIPIVCGGSGLYIRALLGGLFAVTEDFTDIRRRLEREYAERGSSILFQELRDADPATAKRLHPNDWVRVRRALEIFRLTGRPFSSWIGQHQFGDTAFQVLRIGLTVERERLRERIKLRSEKMLDAGLVDEVRLLARQGYGRELRSMRALGYRQVWDYWEGKIRREQLLLSICQKTAQYAKRQTTWFRRESDVTWVYPEQYAYTFDKIQRFLGAG